MRLLLCLTILLSLLSLPAPPAGATGLQLRQPLEGTITRGFDPGPSPWSPGHRGVDLRASPGATVVAAAKGRVHFAGHVAGRPSVSIDHGNGLRTTYTPVSATVSEGDVVEAGQPVGQLVPGHCQPACLHWGLTDGDEYFDPLQYLTERMVRLLPRGATPRPPAPLPAATTGLGPGAAPVDAPITSQYGMRIHPIFGEPRFHDGVDYGAACGTPVRSPWSGRVSAIDHHTGYGLRVHVRHDADLTTAYAHLQRASVSVGDSVAAGMPVGEVGSTGWSTGCHLHWMAWREGSTVDPLSLLDG